MSVTTSSPPFDTTGVIEALSPDMVERAIGNTVAAARENPYVAATLTLVVSGYAIYQAARAAAPVLERAYRDASARWRRMRVAMRTPQHEDIHGRYQPRG